MSQERIIGLLKRNKNVWFDLFGLSKRLRLSVKSVSANLRKLRRDNDVRFRKEKGGHRKYLYQWRKR